jgi:hypothetical protein
LNLCPAAGISQPTDKKTPLSHEQIIADAADGQGGTTMKPTDLEAAAAQEARRPRPISERETARTILGLLLCEPHSFTRAELVRELGGQTVATQDAIENLVCSGLANREGEAITASRAARAFDELEP